MTGPRGRVRTAETEAAAWHARLGARSVSPRDIEEFFAWRRSPANEDAYRRVEAIWGATPALKTSPDVQAALDAALSRRRPPARRFAMAAGAAAAFGAAAVVAIAAWTWRESRPVFETSVGEQRLVQLADGSAVRLDTDSRIRVRFGQASRAVELESGQALFVVAHDPSRPFTVDAGLARVTAVGTVFDVRRDQAGARVTLISGAVDVAGGDRRAPGRRLTAGQQALTVGRAMRVAAVDVERQTAWVDGRIVFRDTPLRTAVAEINRYLTDKVELGAGTPDRVLVNGVFRAGDREAFVSAVSEVFDLEAVRRPDGAVRLTRR